MSEVKVNKISPRTNCGTVTLGDSGDTFTIPAGVSISNSGTASGFGSTGEVSWVTTKKTTTFTVTAGEGYFCDTSSGGFTANLPAGTAGASFAVADYTNTFQNNGLTISPNGSQKIGGIAANLTLATEGQSAYFVYIDDTEGWKNVIDSTSNLTGNAFISATGGTITTSGNCKIHTFTGPGTFTVSGIAQCSADNLVSYMVVAGGGGGGGDYGSGSSGGGGGAGGFRELVSPTAPYTASPLNGYPNAPNRITVTAAAFPITVGAGGAGGNAPPSPDQSGIPGSNSIFSTITSTGGGGGGEAYRNSNGKPGGSGGGAGGNPSMAIGNGNTPSTTPAQGSNGGLGYCGNPTFAGGAGGGATAVGAAGTGSGGGAGGAGATTEITASPVVYAGGGGGAGKGAPPGAGGSGGGGAGGANGACGVNGTVNTGGGGGGGAHPGARVGGTGGSGIVVIRYKFQ